MDFAIQVVPATRVGDDRADVFSRPNGYLIVLADGAGGTSGGAAAADAVLASALTFFPSSSSDCVRFLLDLDQRLTTVGQTTAVVLVVMGSTVFGASATRGARRSRALRCAMPSAVEIAVDTYVRMWSERDPAVRATMLDACFAANGRMVTRSREICGRIAFAELMTSFLADPQLLRIRVISAIDAKGTTFRFRSVVERRDGATLENFDAGQIDADGRIALLLTFAGPLDGSD